MPIIQLPGGIYKYGKTGKVYPSREKSRKQGIAIELDKLRREGRLEEKNGKIYVKGSSKQRAYRRK